MNSILELDVADVFVLAQFEIFPGLLFDGFLAVDDLLYLFNLFVNVNHITLTNCVACSMGTRSILDNVIRRPNAFEGFRYKFVGRKCASTGCSFARSCLPNGDRPSTVVVWLVSMRHDGTESRVQQPKSLLRSAVSGLGVASEP